MGKKILIDIGHPAHVHYFRNFIRLMQTRGYEFFITARDRKDVFQLLRSYNLPFTSRGKGSSHPLGKLLYLLRGDFFLYRQAKTFKPDLLLGFGIFYIAHAAALLRKPCIIFDDTENARWGQMLYKPFAHLICSPTCFSKNFGKKHLKFDGYMELCYLHPGYFTPDPSVLDLLKVRENEKYVILRFVSRQASHDMGHRGISAENKTRAVQAFSRHARVFISSEEELPDRLKQYRIDIPVEKMHDALYYASLLYGESATMASECAVLGTPAIFLDNQGRGYTREEEEKYGLVFNFTESPRDQEKSIEKGLELLKSEGTALKRQWQEKRQKLLLDKIDVTAFMVRLIENYPHSVAVMKESPGGRVQ